MTKGPILELGMMLDEQMPEIEGVHIDEGSIFHYRAQEGDPPDRIIVGPYGVTLRLEPGGLVMFPWHKVVRVDYVDKE